MKRVFVFSLFTALFVNHSFGQGVQEMIKQKAKNIRDQNNARQGVPPPQAPPPPSAPAAPSGPQGISQAQQQSIDKLSTDLSAIKPGSEATADQKQQISTDILALAKGVSKPSKESLTKLVNNLSATLSDKSTSMTQQPQLAKSINVVVNSGNLTLGQSQAFIKAALDALKSAGVNEQQLQSIGTDLKSIVTDLQKSKPRLYQ
jgi:methyl-accepting chemotaxis protein